MQLSPNFTLGEFTKSQTALRRGIFNAPSAEAVENLKALCVNVLQPLRDRLWRPIVISSGYRSTELNRAIGGSETSQHCKGQAADIESPGVSNEELAWMIHEDLEFDQMILEHHYPHDPASGWVHVSWKPEGRRNEFLGYNSVDKYWRIA